MVLKTSYNYTNRLKLLIKRLKNLEEQISRSSAQLEQYHGLPPNMQLAKMELFKIQHEIVIDFYFKLFFLSTSSRFI